MLTEPHEMCAREAEFKSYVSLVLVRRNTYV
jgi:hypothetical protein